MSVYKQLLAVTDASYSRLSTLPGPTVTQIPLLKNCLHCMLLLLLLLLLLLFYFHHHHHQQHYPSGRAV